MSSSQALLVVRRDAGAARRDEVPTRARHRKALVHAAFGVVGLAAIALLVRGVGAATLLAILRSSARWLPRLIALDALRIVAEGVATYSLSARVRREVPFGELVRVHVVGYAIAMNVPAGRVTAEAVKAAMLSRHVGAPEAAAVAAGNQASVMLSSVVAMMPCLAAALWLTGASPLSGSFAALAAVVFAAFAAFQLACRRSKLGGTLLRRFTRCEQATEAFQEALERIPVVPRVATLAALAGRAVGALEIAVLLFALGGRHGVGATLLAQGVSLIGGSVGDFVPGQLGAMDGAFALAAPSLGLAVVDGIALSVILHCVQAAWAVVGFALPLVWTATPPAVLPAALDRVERSVPAEGWTARTRERGRAVG
jgi:uncharacterized membrane protein YbhN (UPF0104 family)